MKRKSNLKENFLENEKLGWSEKEGIITLEIENIGVFNRVAQKFFKKPKISYVHLDEMGSFIWPVIDGEKNLIEIGKGVKEHFGEIKDKIK